MVYGITQCNTVLFHDLPSLRLVIEPGILMTDQLVYFGQCRRKRVTDPFQRHDGVQTKLGGKVGGNPGDLSQLGQVALIRQDCMGKALMVAVGDQGVKQYSPGTAGGFRIRQPMGRIGSHGSRHEGQ